MTVGKSPSTTPGSSLFPFRRSKRRVAELDAMLVASEQHTQFWEARAKRFEDAILRMPCAFGCARADESHKPSGGILIVTACPIHGVLGG